MSSVFTLVALMVFLSESRCQSHRQSTPTRFKSGIEPIDVDEITFTTPPTDLHHYPSIRNPNYYGAKDALSRGVSKSRPGSQNEVLSRLAATAPNTFLPASGSTGPDSNYDALFIPTPEVYKVAVYKPDKPYQLTAGSAPETFKPAASSYKKETKSKPEVFRTVIDDPTSGLKNDVFGTVVGAPPDVIKQYSNKVARFPNSQFSPSLPVKSPNYFPTGASNNYIPISAPDKNNFFNTDLPSITDEDLKQFEKLTEQDFNQKETYSTAIDGSPSYTPQKFNQQELYSKKAQKFAEAPTAPEQKESYQRPQQLEQHKDTYHRKPNKKPVYPKKYTSAKSKKQKPVKKVKPVQETKELPVESEAPTRTSPVSFYKASPSHANPFSSDLSSFHESTGASEAAFPVSSPIRSANGERVEFQMYGMDGPHSYKFGYDTGEGHNRHFRFEERDNDGKVRGHYGYMDKDGKMRIMKYEADPHTGFHAGPYQHPENSFN